MAEDDLLEQLDSHLNPPEIPAESFKILSLDGGGINGAYAASLLANLSLQLDDPIADYFDLIAGTSTGGIIALGLGLGVQPSEIQTLYEDKGTEIFPKRNKYWGYVRGRHRFKSKPLKDALTEILGDKKFGESKQRLLIPSWHANSGKVHYYKTAHHKNFQNDYKKPALDVAMSTSAAPTFFSPFVSKSGLTFLDGGLFANNPINVAINEAISIFSKSSKDIFVLSIGSPNSKPKFGHGPAWFRPYKIIDLLMQAQSTSAISAADFLTSYPNTGDHIFRYAPESNEADWAMENSQNLPLLIELGEIDARQAITKLRPVFFTEPASAFNPHYQLCEA